MNFYTKCGISGKKLVFILSDTRLVNDGFLEVITNILNIDEIPKLSSQEEMNKICNEIFAFTKQIDVNDSVVMHKHENNSEAESKRQNKVMKEEIDIV